MSDHHGPPHDLPEYVPNWPVPIKVKAKVYRTNSGWGWAHDCPRKLGFSIGFIKRTQGEAFEAALKHARGCW